LLFPMAFSWRPYLVLDLKLLRKLFLLRLLNMEPFKIL
jgi:hypothetical protein